MDEMERFALIDHHAGEHSDPSKNVTYCRICRERDRAEELAYEAHREEEGTLTEIEERERELAAERQADRSE